MTKALQERIFARANLEVPRTLFAVVRYGNVLASRGSVIPLFHEQIRHGGPVTITHVEMTRFLLSLEDAVDVVLAAVRGARPGETYIPQAATALMTDLANVLIDGRPIETVVTGIRPGEKLHEILISEEEAHRAFRRGNHYVVAPILPELRNPSAEGAFLEDEYSSANNVITRAQLRDLLVRRELMVGTGELSLEGELLR
jgi:UDP-glucose 4-epimerase